MLVVDLAEKFQRLSIFLGTHGLGAHDLALVQFAHHHLGHRAVTDVIDGRYILGLAQVGNRLVKVSQLLVDPSLTEQGPGIFPLVAVGLEVAHCFVDVAVAGRGDIAG